VIASAGGVLTKKKRIYKMLIRLYTNPVKDRIEANSHNIMVNTLANTLDIEDEKNDVITTKGHRHSSRKLIVGIGPLLSRPE
jgi:hypothetical protein